MRGIFAVLSVCSWVIFITAIFPADESIDVKKSREETEAKGDDAGQFQEQTVEIKESDEGIKADDTSFNEQEDTVKMKQSLENLYSRIYREREIFARF